MKLVFLGYVSRFSNSAVNVALINSQFSLNFTLKTLHYLYKNTFIKFYLRN